jgi:phytoene/squalene synthetase
LKDIEESRYRVFARRITLSPPRRLAAALGAWFKHALG